MCGRALCVRVCVRVDIVRDGRGLGAFLGRFLFYIPGRPEELRPETRKSLITLGFYLSVPVVPVVPVIN